VYDQSGALHHSSNQPRLVGRGRPWVGVRRSAGAWAAGDNVAFQAGTGGRWTARGREHRAAGFGRRQHTPASAPAAPRAHARSINSLEGWTPVKQCLWCAIITACQATFWLVASSHNKHPLYQPQGAPFAKDPCTSEPTCALLPPSPSYPGLLRFLHVNGSEVLLFCGHYLAGYSAPFALLVAWMCPVYHKRRVGPDAEVVREAFGADCANCCLRAPKLHVHKLYVE
jgi:hypothetical protein